MDLTFLRDRAFMRTMLSIAVPIMLQQLISASLNLIDVAMVGQLGETAVAALGLANQLFFLLSLFLFGTTSGMAIFTAQYWGRGDVARIRQVLGICLAVAGSIALLFTLLAVLWPERVLRLYSADPEVVRLGAGYLRIVGWSYLITAISFAYASVLRTVRRVTLPVSVTLVALGLKTALSYLLIFGNLGFPALGVNGAALATTLARGLELGLLLFLTYRLQTPLAAPLRDLVFDRPLFVTVLRTALPATINEIFWSLGITSYAAIYARISTAAIAAININGTIEQLAFVGFSGMASACAVMVGNAIGAGERETAREYGNRYILLGFVLSLLVGGLVVAARGALPWIYPRLEPDSLEAVRRLMLIFGLTIWVRETNLMVLIGLLRAGGDTRFGLWTETLAMWLVGVPSALLGAFVFGLPVQTVYLLVLLDELVKLVVGLRRFRSGKWIHDLVGAAA